MSYALKNGIALRAGDAVTVEQNAACQAAADGLVRACADSESRFRFTELTEDCVTVEVTDGAVYFDDVTRSDSVTVTVAGAALCMEPELHRGGGGLQRHPDGERIQGRAGDGLCG
jgi:hypothetical protein